MNKLNAFQLKFIALVIMLMDHLYFAFPKVFPLWFHPLSRFVGVLFAFLMVEGFFYTSNKMKYNVRLFGWAIFMQVGNLIIKTIFVSKNISVENNIFMTLALGLLILNLIELSKNEKGVKKIILVLLRIVCIVSSVLVEGGIVIIPFILITYYFRDNNKKLMLGYLIFSVLMFWGLDYTSYESIEITIQMLMFNSDFLFITVIPFILLYNGKRGPNGKFNKYLFYAFYPFHLWLLAGIKFILE